MDLKEYMAYCVHCKKKQRVRNPEIVELKGKHGKRKAVKGICMCGTKVCAILKSK